MENEYKNFCFAIYEEAHSFLQCCQKFNPALNPDLQCLISAYVDMVKKSTEAKKILLEEVKSRTPSLGTMKQSLRQMVMNDERIPQHYAQIEREVEKFLNNPEGVITFLEKEGQSIKS